MANDVQVNPTWVDTEEINRYNAKRKLGKFDGFGQYNYANGFIIKGMWKSGK